MHLSPREHRTEVSLSVGDMSVQRLHVSQQDASDEVSFFLNSMVSFFEDLSHVRIDFYKSWKYFDIFPVFFF